MSCVSVCAEGAFFITGNENLVDKVVIFLVNAIDITIDNVIVDIIVIVIDVIVIVELIFVILFAIVIGISARPCIDYIL